jgi:hypothetical protein
MLISVPIGALQALKVKETPSEIEVTKREF